MIGAGRVERETTGLGFLAHVTIERPGTIFIGPGMEEFGMTGLPSVPSCGLLMKWRRLDTGRHYVVRRQIFGTVGGKTFDRVFAVVRSGTALAKFQTGFSRLCDSVERRLMKVWRWYLSEITKGCPLEITGGQVLECPQIYGISLSGYKVIWVPVNTWKQINANSIFIKFGLIGVRKFFPIIGNGIFESKIWCLFQNIDREDYWQILLRLAYFLILAKNLSNIDVEWSFWNVYWPVTFGENDDLICTGGFLDKFSVTSSLASSIFVCRSNWWRRAVSDRSLIFSVTEPLFGKWRSIAIEPWLPLIFKAVFSGTICKL